MDVGVCRAVEKCKGQTAHVPQETGINTALTFVLMAVDESISMKTGEALETSAPFCSKAIFAC